MAICRKNAPTLVVRVILSAVEVVSEDCDQVEAMEVLVDVHQLGQEDYGHHQQKTLPMTRKVQ